MTTLTEQNKSIALRFAQDGWGTNAGWREIWDELMSADVVHHFNSTAEPIVGLEANKIFNEGLFQGFPDIAHKIEDVVAEGDKVVYCTTIQGTHAGNFLGTPPTGKVVKINDFTLLQIADGKIVEWWYECNLLEVMQLNRKTYRLANQLPPFSEEERRSLAKQCLEDGKTATRSSLTALAQAKLAYVSEVFSICSRYRCKAFASIINRNSPSPSPIHLRKDYAYLFERFFYFLEDKDTSLSGIIVFDELEKTRSHLLIKQMDRYFKHTIRGKQRAGQIIPEPFFVHSDLTTGIQLADFAAYIASWNVRFEGMNEPRRSELDDLTEQLLSLRYRAIREVNGNPNYQVWSFAVITDLRAREDRVET